MSDTNRFARGLRLTFSIVCAALVLCLLILLGLRCVQSPGAAAKQEAAPEAVPVSIVDAAVEKFQRQAGITQSLEAELLSGGYTFEEPLVVVDPYEESPLTALVLFDTEEPCRIRVEIPGEKDCGFSHTFPEETDRHQIPVYGLYPDAETPVKLQMLSAQDQVLGEVTLPIQTEPLSDDLKGLIILTETYGDAYAEGLNFDCVHKQAYDREGTVRWYLSDTQTINYHVMEPRYLDHHFVVSSVSTTDSMAVFYEIDLLGRIYNLYASEHDCHHDICPLPNGNLLIPGNGGETMMDLLYELDRETGECVRMMDFKEILQRSRYLPGPCSLKDWMHLNSVVYDESDGTILVSSNQQSAVMKLTWPEGEIRWILGDPTGYMPRLQKYLLTPVGENFEYSYNQHDATILPDYDQDPDTVDILLFDNGYARFLVDRDLQRQIRAGEATEPENYSRLVHYRINEARHTVEQIWQYGKERGAELYAETRGSAQLTPMGSIVGCFHKEQNFPQGTFRYEARDLKTATHNMVEVDAQGQLLWDSEILSMSDSGMVMTYRGLRLPVYYEDSRQHDVSAPCANKIH